MKNRVRNLSLKLMLISRKRKHRQMEAQSHLEELIQELHTVEYRMMKLRFLEGISADALSNSVLSTLDSIRKSTQLPTIRSEYQR